MNAHSNSPGNREFVDEVSKWGVGAGILAVAIAPLAIPILVLTLATLVLLAVPAIPLALIAGLVYLPIRVVRRLRKDRLAQPQRGASQRREAGADMRVTHPGVSQPG